MDTKSQRIYFLDTLRAYIIFLVLILHSSLVFVTEPSFPGWIHNPQTDKSFWLIGIYTDSFIMSVLFFISGYFTLPSLLKRTNWLFIKDKLIRLGIPYLIGIFILAPMLTLIIYFANGGATDSSTSLLMVYSPQIHSQFQFWYLGILLVFFFLIVVVHKMFPIFTTKVQTISRPTWKFFVSIIVITTVLSFTMNLFFPYIGITAWTRWVILQFQTVRLPIYLFYFLLGIYAYRHSWFQDGYKPRFLFWAVIYGISSCVYLLHVISGRLESTTISDKLIFNFWGSITLLSALLTLLAFFQKLRTGKLVQIIANRSFWAYVTHLNILFVIAYYTLYMNIPIFYKFLLQFILTLFFAWGIPILIDLLRQKKNPTPSISVASTSNPSSGGVGSGQSAAVAATGSVNSPTSGATPAAIPSVSSTPPAASVPTTAPVVTPEGN